MKYSIFATMITTIYLAIYSILTQFPTASRYAFYMFLLSPVLVLWMVAAVLKDRNFKAQSLGNHEFGYQDRPDKGASMTIN